ncbi:MAG TPA: AAA family ATPase [Gemmatimonadales bacterium]
MNDQASTLRARRDGARPVERDPERPVLVIGSGKGGVGKSIVAVMASAALARTGRRVLLVDGAQNLGNLHVLLGVRPSLTPAALLDDGAIPDQLLIEVSPGLWLLPADSGAESVHRLGATDRARLHRRLTGVYCDFDIVVVDAAAGLDGAVRCVAMHATRLIVVTVPEPAALTDAYALMKIVHGQLPRLPFDLLVNRTQHVDEGATAFDRLSTATTRFLGRDLHYAGAIPEDTGMRALARDPRALLGPDGNTPAQLAVQQLIPSWCDSWVPDLMERSA